MVLSVQKYTMAAFHYRKTLSRAFSFAAASASLTKTLSTHIAPCSSHSLLSRSLQTLAFRSTIAIPNLGISSCPWSIIQHRDVSVSASELRPGNVIEKSGRIYQVVDAEHKMRGRGGAAMQVVFRCIDTGNKISFRFGTDEAVERVFVEEKSFTCLYTESETAFLIEPDTFDQLEVPLDLFGKAASYLKGDMKVRLLLYDDRPLSGSIPKHVTCTVKETQPHVKGISATPRYKKALLDNGLTVQGLGEISSHHFLD
ncbi:elongation factor P isoform X2 [Tripterygium wilfordii]|uniref:elongation factor P isoform X2 n=1 Tax=Tripterygium wilfordii TaxID=458696 RepID=UPI0018F8010E|nr:elongation factor P isoform X2 [Tripterygium wilfordii]